MARLVYSAMMSLDGFIAGPDGDMAWLAPHAAPDEASDRLLAQTGCILAGNRTFGGDDPNAGTDAEGAFGGQYHGPAVVLTHRPSAVEGVEFRTDLASAVARSRELAGDGYVNVLGADVARQCFDAGEIDEVLVLIAPVLLGGGTPLYSGSRQVDLVPKPGESALWFTVSR
jgi:dihydrofolate reductase